MVLPIERAGAVDHYLSAAEVAQRLAVSRSWVYKHKRDLGGVLVGDRMWRFSEDGIQAYLHTRAPRLEPTRRQQPAARRVPQWRLDY